MKKIFTLLLITGVISIKAGAQTAKTFYGEFGGNGIVFSANYDGRFIGQKGMGFRLGMGFAGVAGASILTFPIGLNYLSGKAPHYFEAGMGITFVTGTVDVGFGSASGNGTLFMPTFGYRYAPLGKGFTGRIYVGPIIGGGSAIFPWGGLSVGYKL